jgi:light-regulated signal transduction histidine kinase (bacteriophytochrome)
MDCKQQLDQLQKEFEEFTYIISHDLNAPIRAISNLTEWIEEDLEGVENQDIKENLKLLKNRSQKMSAMISAITKISRINRKDLDIISVSTTKIFSDIKEDIEFRFPNCMVHIPNENFTLNTFEKKIQSVISEIIENSAKHNLEIKKLEISISVETSSDYLVIFINDNGKGVPADQIDKILSMFYTLQSKDKSNTLGAGLAIVKKILDFVGGTIELTSHNNNFQVKLKWPINVK